MKKVYIILFGFCLFWCLSQKRDNYSFELDKLRKRYELKQKNDTTVLPLVKQYIRLSKIHKNEKALYQGYKDAVLFNASPSTKMLYADSTVAIALKSRNNSYITSAYLGKGIIYYFYFRKYKAALSEYLQAYNYAVRNDDLYLRYKVVYHMGVIKTYLGYYLEALDNFEQCSQYYNSELKKSSDANEIYNNKKGYLNTLHQMTVCYLNRKEYRKSDSLIALGLALSSHQKDFILENAYFNKCKSILLFDLGHYKKSNRQLTNALPPIQKTGDFAWTSVIYNYLMLNNIKLHNNDLALFYFRKVDSIFNRYNFMLPEIRAGYEYQIAFYKKRKNLKEQLYYTNQLIRADSLMSTEFTDLSGKIHKEYDTRQLQIDKSRLEQSNYQRTVFLISAIAIAVVMTILFTLYFIRENRLTRRYRFLQEQLAKNVKLENHGDQIVKADLKMRKTILHPDLYQKLSTGIQKFEKEKGFTDREMSLSKLAKRLNTNTNYLSVFINEEKGCNFNRYLSGLRIHYITHKLFEERKFLNYTIEALALECGFSSRQQFSELFFEINGIRPKDYIRKRKEEQESQ